MTPVADACQELATLTPRLAPALRRDTAAGDTRGGYMPLSLVNTDVMQARITLLHQVPAVTIHAAQLINAAWQPRNYATCLTALPPFDDRLRNLGMTAEHHHLETITAAWVRLAKRALGLRHPDINIGQMAGRVLYCPDCLSDGTPTPGQLYTAGSEAFIHGNRLVWVHNPHVWCPECGASWPQHQWDLLAQVLAQQTRDQRPLPGQATGVAS